MCTQDCKYELIKQGVRAGCEKESLIEKIQDIDEDSCKEKCNGDNSCTHLWHGQGLGTMKVCRLYSSCNGVSNLAFPGKRLKKKQRLTIGKYY